MLSIIICSRSQELLTQVSSNIKETIGVPYEIISVDNSKSKYGICEAYNIGAQQSKFLYLCFMHEDILFHTKDWGKIVVDTLTDETIGVIGVAGGIAKACTPSGWYTSSHHDSRINVLQRRWDGERVLDYYNPNNELVCDVVTVDGVWICCRKTVWEAHKFDEKTFKEFHFYDLDFSMQVFQSHRVCVIYTVLIEHLSPGSMNKSWLKEAFTFSKKWKAKLPISVEEVSLVRWKKIEYGCYKCLLKIMIDLNVKNWSFLVYSFKYFYFNPRRRPLKNVLKGFIRNLFPKQVKYLKDLSNRKE